jgi:hypothetical protein
VLLDFALFILPKSLITSHPEVEPRKARRDRSRLEGLQARIGLGQGKFICISHKPVLDRFRLANEHQPLPSIPGSISTACHFDFIHVPV